MPLFHEMAIKAHNTELSAEVHSKRDSILKMFAAPEAF